MASLSRKSLGMEFCESEIVKPQPLRVIKRSQTISHCSPSGKSLDGGLSTPKSFNQCEGSPPMGIEWPVTVKKRRRQPSHSISSIFSDTSGCKQATVAQAGAQSQMCGMISRKDQAADLSISEKNTVAPDDSEVTPKIIRSVARNSSAAAYLKTERNQRRLNADLSSCSVRGVKNSFRHLNKDDIHNISHQRRSLPSTSERSFSRSSNVFMRALTGRCHQKPKLSSPMNQDQFMSLSTPSSHRSSRSKKSSSSSTQLDSRSSEYLDTKNYYHNAYIHDANTSLDALISVQKIQDPELKSENVSAINQPLNTFILCPEIEITPEISAIGTTSCDLWVAVEVKGSLKKADGSSGKCTTGQSLNSAENRAIKSQGIPSFLGYSLF
ncbi:unnamed protein product [Blumeria hordei]|uniref:Uncharacterized protein n=1 Tax=Blumeria hordei TaxID=2867405 RepID=A0A383UVJ6_BLUHO|nr:unnamed protein product [Blumeria hordei]